MPQPQPQDLELFHFGVKGMKWGVRKAAKDRVESTRSSAKQAVKESIKRPVADDAKAAGGKRSTVKKHGTDALSNKELKQLVERMNLEQQYANLHEQGKSASVRASGRSYVADILKDAGRDLATEAIKFGVRKAAGAAANRATRGRGGYTSWENSSGQGSIGMIRKALTA